MKKIKIIRKLTLVAFVISTFFYVTGCKKNEFIDEIPTVYLSPSYVINMDNLEEVVGFCDNVFLGYVGEITGTNYDASIPRTCFVVTVIDNIKGELPVNEMVEVQKSGGLLEDSISYLLFEDDCMPTVGQYYIFAVKDSNGDGIFVASGKNTVALVNYVDNVNSYSSDSNNSERSSKIVNSDVYQKYEEAYYNEIPYEF